MNVGKSSSRCSLGVKPQRLSLLITALVLLLWMGNASAGASCVVAKKLGDSLAIEWIASPDETVESAIFKAKQKLLDQGYRKKGQDVHAQASTSMPHAFMVIIKTNYITRPGRTRTSYGCGYSARSIKEAERAAVYDLRNYSWGWKPDFGYEVVESIRY